MDVSIGLAETKQQLDGWNDFVLSCPCASHFSSTDWLSSYVAFGVQVKCLVVTSVDGAIIGGAPLLVFRVGPWRWLQIPHGPCISPERRDLMPRLLEAIDDFAKDVGAMFVQASPFEPSKDHERWAERARRCKLPYDPNLLKESDCGISEALAAVGFVPGGRSGFINSPGEGQIVQLDVDDLLATFRRDARRHIRDSTLSDLVTRSVSSLEELAEAYQALSKHFARKRVPFRPWPAFRRGVWPALQSDRAVVLMAVYHSRLLGSLVLLFGGGRGIGAFSGCEHLNIKGVYPDHFLHYAAMLETLRRGYSRYDLGEVGVKGIANFKRSFRPTYFHLVEPMTKVYRPRLMRSYLLAYPHLKKYKRPIGNLVCAVRSLFEKV